MLSPNPMPGPVGKSWERLWEASVELLPLGGPVPPTPEFTFGCSQGSCPAWLKAGDVLNLSLGEQAAKFVPGAGVREAFPARVSEGSMETRT